MIEVLIPPAMTKFHLLIIKELNIKFGRPNKRS